MNGKPVVLLGGIAFGTRVRITVAGLDQEAGTLAANAALLEIRAVDAMTSLYQPQSPLSILNASGQIVAPDPRLLALFETARRWSLVTSGAFDVTVQPLWTLYARFAARGLSPPESSIRRVLRNVDYREIVSQEARIFFRRPGMQVTLNGIVQGYAADRALQVLRAHGVEHALVDAGEFVATGERPNGGPWQVAVRDAFEGTKLSEVFGLADAAIATSADSGYVFSSDRRHHHILDPRTGYSPTELASVTAVAPDGVSADALSTAAMVMGGDASIRFLDRLPGCRALLVDKSGRQTLAL